MRGYKTVQYKGILYHLSNYQTASVMIGESTFELTLEMTSVILPDSMVYLWPEGCRGLVGNYMETIWKMFQKLSVLKIYRHGPLLRCIF